MIAVAAYAARGWGSIFHGLTPTAKCCRRFAAPLEPRTRARHVLSVFGERASRRRRVGGQAGVPGWPTGKIYLKILSPGSVVV